MTQTSFYLDCRAVGEGSPAPSKVRMTFKKKTLLVNLGLKILPVQWYSSSSCIVNHPKKKQLNDYITTHLTQINSELMRLEVEGKLKTYEPSALRALLEGAV